MSSLGLGPLHAISLAHARDEAEAIRKQLRDGIDPKQAQLAEQQAAVAAANSMTFDQAAFALPPLVGELPEQDQVSSPKWARLSWRG